MFRRSFIKSIFLLSLSPLLGWDKLFNWFKSAKPVTDRVNELFAIYNRAWSGDTSLTLHWEDPIPIFNNGLPKDWTYRDILINVLDSPADDEPEQYFPSLWGLSVIDLDKPAPEDEVEEWWWSWALGTSESVFHYLRSVDLSNELYSELIWSDGNCMSRYVGVEIENEVTLKKLEKELNLLGKNVRFIVQDM